MYFYNVSNNGLIAITNILKDAWNCIIIVNKIILKDKISKISIWKIKINQNKINSGDHDICVGIEPNIFKSSLIYDKCWSIYSSPKIFIEKCIIRCDIIEVIVEKINWNLSFAINDVNFGIAISKIPKEDDLYPTISSYEQGISVEIV